MSTTFSGSLQIKKKAELQEIAQALAINDNGTREDLQQRIKKHLEDNSADLEADPAFSGLYTTRGGRRQRSLQPSNVTQATHVYVAEGPKFTAIAEERAMTPPLENRASLSPTASPARRSPRNMSLPSSPTKSIIADMKEQPEIQAALQMKRNFAGSVLQKITSARAYLSNSRNIFVVSAVLDFLRILYNIHINSVFPIPPIYSASQPALSATALATLYWGAPSILLPVVIGYLVSFSSPASQPRFDVLSAAIARLAANFVDVYPAMVFVEKKDAAVQSLDVLGFKWRAVSSGVALAFAFAEAIVRRNDEV